MKEFFTNQNNGMMIEIFSMWHIVLIIITLLLVDLIINNKEKISIISNKNKKIIRITFGIFLLFNMIIRRGSFIFYDVYNIQNNLDINFCNFTSIIFMIYAFTGNKKIYQLCYYMAFIGPLTAIIFPSVSISPLNYSFYSFIIIHHVVFIFNFIFMYFENEELKIKNIIFYILLYFIIIYVIDYIFNFNYNKPLFFINDDIKNNKLIIYLLEKKLLSYVTLIFIIFFQIINGKIISKIFALKKDKNL